jgi:hypothetical protein
LYQYLHCLFYFLSVILKTIFGFYFPFPWIMGRVHSKIWWITDADPWQNGPPTSNIPQLAQAHVAPLLANGGVNVKKTNGNGYSKFGSRIDCRRCGTCVWK